jgi:hypothetical protein
MMIGENEVLDFLRCMLVGLGLTGLSLCLGAVCGIMASIHCCSVLDWLRKPSIASNCCSGKM